MKDSKVIILFLAIFAIIGMIILCLGIQLNSNAKEKTKDYIETTGYFYDTEIYSDDEDGTTYKLLYHYTVDDKEYSVSTDYGTSIIPKENSEKTIRYNPNNPSESIIKGFNGYWLMIILGFAFTFVATILLIVCIRNNTNASSKDQEYNREQEMLKQNEIFGYEDDYKNQRKE